MADQKPKIGAGHVDAMIRAGFKEITQILPAFPAQGIQPVEEQGLVGNPTNIEVLRDKEQENQAQGLPEASTAYSPANQPQQQAQQQSVNPPPSPQITEPTTVDPVQVYQSGPSPEESMRQMAAMQKQQELQKPGVDSPAMPSYPNPIQMLRERADSQQQSRGMER